MTNYFVNYVVCLKLLCFVKDIFIFMMKRFCGLASNLRLFSFQAVKTTLSMYTTKACPSIS